MSWVRIFATYAGEGDEDSTADKQETIILQAKINEDNRLDPISQYFGYTQELDEDSGTYEKYPFFCNIQHEGLFMDFGAGLNEGRLVKSNLPQKTITINEVFTYFNGLEDGVDKWTYRIENITRI